MKKNGQTRLFFPWYSPLVGMRQNQAKNQWRCVVLQFQPNIEALLFQKYNKSLELPFKIQPQTVSFHFIYVR